MANDDQIKALNARIEELTRRMGLMEDTHAVRCLHFKYGYYIDKCLYDEAVDLFADDARAHFLNGVYLGKAGVRRLYCSVISSPAVTTARRTGCCSITCRCRTSSTSLRTG